MPHYQFVFKLFLRLKQSVSTLETECFHARNTFHEPSLPAREPSLPATMGGWMSADWRLADEAVQLFQGKNRV